MIAAAAIGFVEAQKGADRAIGADRVVHVAGAVDHRDEFDPAALPALVIHLVGAPIVVPAETALVLDPAERGVGGIFPGADTGLLRKRCMGHENETQEDQEPFQHR